MNGWRALAACRASDPDLFFPVVKGIPDEAVALCRRCPVRAECAAFAKHSAMAGVWAGVRLDEEPLSDGLTLRRGRPLSRQSNTTEGPRRTPTPPSHLTKEIVP